MTRTKIIFLAFSLIAVITFSFYGFSLQQDKEPWTPQQLMEPADLAKILGDPKAPHPIVFCIGPDAVIKNSIFIGPTGSKANLDKFREQASRLAKNAKIVIYCGCCPFNRCPNIRPAFRVMNELGLKNAKLLNLSHNVKVDWIEQGYPVND
jgi:thiosulfate/3-mercaptopyruvate sulfurtransferase